MSLSQRQRNSRGLGASLVAQLVKNLPAVREPGFHPWVGQIPWRRERLPPPVFWPGEFHGLYSPWDCKASDTTEQLSLSLFSPCFRNVQVDDIVTVGECQPLSKIVLFNVLKVTNAARTKHSRNSKTGRLPISPNQLISQYKSIV